MLIIKKKRMLFILLLITLSAICGYIKSVYAINEPTLVLDLAMNEKINSQILDSSGYGNDGTLRYNPALTKTYINNEEEICLTLVEDLNQRVDCFDNEVFHLYDNEVYTLEYWWRSTTTDARYFIIKNGEGGYWSVRTTSSAHLVQLYNGQICKEIKYTSTLADGQWHHVAFIIDRIVDEGDMYVDGTKVVSGANIALSGDIATSSFLYIGYNPYGQWYVDMEIDDLHFYHGELTSYDIITHYARGLAAAYDFDINDGSTIFDSSGHDNHGTLVGSPTFEMAYFNGKEGRYLQLLESQNQRVDISDDPIFHMKEGGVYTFEYWWRSDALTHRYYMIKTGVGGYWSIYTSDSAHTFQLYNGQICKEIKYTSTLADGEWHYLVFVVDRKNNVGEMYVDGEQVVSSANIDLSGDIATTNRLYLGYNPINGKFVDMEIDEFKIYHKRFIQEEIEEKYNQSRELALDNPNYNYQITAESTGTIDLLIDDNRENSEQIFFQTVNPTDWVWLTFDLDNAYYIDRIVISAKRTLANYKFMITMECFGAWWIVIPNCECDYSEYAGQMQLLDFNTFTTNPTYQINTELADKIRIGIQGFSEGSSHYYPGDVQEIEIYVAPQAQIKGYLYNEGGGTLAGVNLAFTDANTGEDLGIATTAANGYYHLTFPCDRPRTVRITNNTLADFNTYNYQVDIWQPGLYISKNLDSRGFYEATDDLIYHWPTSEVGSFTIDWEYINWEDQWSSSVLWIVAYQTELNLLSASEGTTGDKDFEITNQFAINHSWAPLLVNVEHHEYYDVYTYYYTQITHIDTIIEIFKDPECTIKVTNYAIDVYPVSFPLESNALTRHNDKDDSNEQIFQLLTTGGAIASAVAAIAAEAGIMNPYTAGGIALGTAAISGLQYLADVLDSDAPHVIYDAIWNTATSQAEIYIDTLRDDEHGPTYFGENYRFGAVSLSKRVQLKLPQNGYGDYYLKVSHQVYFSKCRIICDSPNYFGSYGSYYVIQENILSEPLTFTELIFFTYEE